MSFNSYFCVYYLLAGLFLASGCGDDIEPVRRHLTEHFSPIVKEGEALTPKNRNRELEGRSKEAGPVDDETEEATSGSGAGHNRNTGAENSKLPSELEEELACFQNNSDDYRAAGRYEVRRSGSGRVKIYEPSNFPDECKMPVVHLANGTGANCSFYSSISEHLASHGFLVSCYESSSTGSGMGCIRALDTLFSEYGDRVVGKFGSTGHSQGGGAAITCGYLAEQKYGDKLDIAIHAIEPAHGMSRASWKSEYPSIESPVFMLSGSSDTVVSSGWVRQGYEILKAPTYWYVARGASHMNAQPWAAESALIWFRWQLLGDNAAGQKLMKLTEDRRWSFQDKKFIEELEKGLSISP